MTSLAARLYAAFSAEAGNLAISPHSVAVALTLAAYGARGRTRDEIEAVVAGAGQPVEGGEWVELSSANRLFGQQGLAWQPDLQELLTVVDYADSDAARRVINEWTSGQTHERIPEGTEAAAATAVVMQRAGAMPQPPVPFVVDRPFLFAIHEPSHEVATGTTPLFVGRVVDPSVTSNDPR